MPVSPAPVSVMWFRRDLRLADNPALAHALADGDVVPLFVVDPAFARAGAPRRAFLAACLRSLDRAMGGALVVRHGDPSDVVPAVAAEVGATEVVVARDSGPYGRRRDAAVAERLRAGGRRLRGIGSAYAVDPGSVTKDDGSAYLVFTPFRRRWDAAGWDDPLPAPVDPSWRGRADGIPSDRLPAVADVALDPGVELPAAGEDHAAARWATFVRDHLDRYDEQRNALGVAGTSHLSPDLRWGVLHPRQLLAGLGGSTAHAVFRSELCWREFYADVLHRQPRTAWHNLNPAMDALPVDEDRRAVARFERWAQGATGYPVVDAAMRQLRATGWVHNRARMITASFLVKDLHLPWQWGARHFLAHLVDGDLASNQHGWQWTAGTGTDAAPYFRIFNPVTQGESFDPDGSYVRRWVPELAGVADSCVHSPWTCRSGAPDGYPAPMVDHREERQEALRRYALVRTG